MASRPQHRADLLIAGGANDPNLLALAGAALQRDVSLACIFHAADSEPPLAWHIGSGSLLLDGHALTVRAAFLRYDVFNPTSGDPMRVDRSMAWFAAVDGWLQSDNSIRVFNRLLHPNAANKAGFLAKAHEVGLQIPRTVLSNDRREIMDLGMDSVVKPAAGGAHCTSFSDVDSMTDWNGHTAPAPVFAQERLVYPEYRVFVVGKKSVCFEINSPSLDHRSDRSSEVIYRSELPIPDDTAQKLLDLAGDLGLEFCAFDLKTRPQDSSLCVLEVNSGPMFAAFDRKADGALTSVMLEHLLDE